MYKKVLVPLDGSELAESALPHVKNLAKNGCIDAVILFHAIDSENPFAYQQLPDREATQCLDLPALLDWQCTKLKKYLKDVQLKLIAEGLNVETVIIKAGRPDQSILDYAQLNDVDLIVIATHGYTGMKKMLLGSVALRVLHESYIPVLLIRPESCQT